MEVTVFKNYLKVAWRNLTRHKGYSFINIFGLAVGLAVCLLISMYVAYDSAMTDLMPTRPGYTAWP